MAKLRCRPGDMAFVKKSWNTLLIGRLVLVKAMRLDGNWEVVLLGQPALLPNENYSGHVITTRVIANDKDLTPLRDSEPSDAEIDATVGAERERCHG